MALQRRRTLAGTALSLLIALSAVGCGGPSRPDRPMMPGAEDGHDHGNVQANMAHQGLDPDDKNEFRKREPQPVPPGRKGQWLAVSNHNHSTYWDGKKPLTVLQQEAYLKNLDALVLTDHNTMRGCNSHEFKEPPPGLIMVRGMEWNAFREKGEPVVGHAGLLGMQGTTGPSSGSGLDAMLAEATRRDATIIINHPFTKNNEWTQAQPDPRAHAVEVWNGWWYRVNFMIKNDKALAWWDEALQRGQKLAAVAGTDCHGEWYGDVARNVNMVFAETPDEAGILKGLRAGHVSIASSPCSARLYLEADADGDGVYEAIMGDELPRPAAGELSVRARVLGGGGKKVVFYTARGRVAIEKVNGKDATIPLKVKLGDGPEYVRAELRRNPRLPFSMTAISNPIYIKTSGLQ